MGGAKHRKAKLKAPYSKSDVELTVTIETSSIDIQEVRQAA